MTLPVDYENATVSLDTHPDAHNETNAAVNALDTTVVTLESTVTTIETRVDTLESSGGGSTILSGTATPSVGDGTAGDYYADLDDGILYGPKSATGWGAEQRIAINGTPEAYTDTGERAVRVTFARAGQVTRVRYHWQVAAIDAFFVRAWNSGGTKVTQVAQTQTATGFYEATFATPVTIAAGETWTFSYGGTTASDGVQSGSVQNAVTSTADVAFVGYYHTAPTPDLFPNLLASGKTYWLEPIFEPSDSWPVTVRSLPVALNRVTLQEQTSTPTNPIVDSQILTYCKGNKIVFAFNNAGTMRYKSLAMDAAGVTWVDHGSTAP